MRWIGAAIIGVWSMLGSAAADDHYIKIECQPIGFGHSKLFGSATFTFDIQKKTAHGPMQFFQPMLPATFSDGRIEWVQKIYPASKDHFKYIVDLTERTAYQKEYWESGGLIELTQFHSCKQIAGSPRLFR